MTKHNKELQKLLTASSDFSPEGAFIAGGALTSAFTGQNINDVDMYFKTKEHFIQAVHDAYDNNLWCVAATDRAVTFIKDDNIIQLMHFDFFPTAESIFDAFDFTVCMAAYDLDNKEFIFNEDFMKHAAQRYLRFHSGTRYPYNSLIRVLKYQSRGYTISKSDLLRIGLSCHRVPVTSWDDLAKAIGGQYGEKAHLEDVGDTPYSLEAAIELFKDTEITVTARSEEMPGTSEELLNKLGLVCNAEVI